MYVSVIVLTTILVAVMIKKFRADPEPEILQTAEERYLDLITHLSIIDNHIYSIDNSNSLNNQYVKNTAKEVKRLYNMITDDDFLEFPDLLISSAPDMDRVSVILKN